MNGFEIIVGLLLPVLKNIIALGVLALSNPKQLRSSTARRLQDIIVSVVCPILRLVASASAVRLKRRYTAFVQLLTF
jgi:hypothetical protein